MSTKKFNENTLLVEKIKYFRANSINRKFKFREMQLDKPVSFWIKEDRLLKKRGKEFAIILRTKGCSWALGDFGGCSMCGYIQDSTIENIDQIHIINQFNYALQEKISEITSDEEDFIIKIFNSGSFFDDNEISEDVREHIFKNIEVAIGLETVDDYIRNRYINKGLKFKDFLDAIHLCKENEVGIRAYLLFKPPFLNEQTAIDDCVKSIQKLAELKINTISINPVNIQKNSLVEYLFYQNRYRPPWFYSLFKSLLKAFKDSDILNSVRIISSPSGAGTKRGIHNCLKRECNEIMIKALKEFVLTQNINFLRIKNSEYSCDCLLKYHLQKYFI